MTTSPMNVSSQLANVCMLPSELRDLLPESPISCELIGGSGSSRQYWRCRMTDGSELIATLGTVKAENEAFFYLAERLADCGVNVPQVLAISPDRMAYVQTSIGHRALFDCLERTDLIAAAIDQLALAHSITDIDYSRCYPVAEMDRRAIMWDLNYFKYCFLKPTPGIELDEAALEDDFERIVAEVSSVKHCGLMLRDFQSRNVMIADDFSAVGIIDFQGARRGPLAYDLASFLWQARAGFSDELRSEMISRYCSVRNIDETSFRSDLSWVVVLRILQTLGAYGFRGRIEGKDHFLRSIPPAINSLRKILTNLPLPSILSHISE